MLDVLPSIAYFDSMASRSIDDLERHAAKFWPTALAAREQKGSIIPKLIESQEKFIGILHVADASPTAWKYVLQATKGMPANLFLKHLMVLSDVGGEKLQRYWTNINTFFPKSTMTFHWKGTQHTYRFQAVDNLRMWTNTSLQVDGRGLASPVALTAAMEDVAMLLIHGGASTDPALPDGLIERCTIGALIGQKRELDMFVRQRYIHVSRITGGATANAMGQLCQAYVKDRLQSFLGDWDFSRCAIPGISQTAGRTDMSFDMVAKSPKSKFCAIEVSFQVTTNSTIERKAGQAAARQLLLHKSGHRIAYVIDGAGNLQRRSAISTICRYSDCTVTFKDEELNALAKFLKAM